MRIYGWMAMAVVGATLLGGLLGWGTWVLRGRPHAEAPALALVRAAPQDEAAPEAAVRPRQHPDLRSNPRDGAAETPRLAIVIDDVGESITPVDKFLALGAPLTFSILPDLPHTQGAAARILQAGREYIIHLPMQPEDYPEQNPGPHPLLLSLSLPETQRRLAEYMAELPNAVGANNHMGSAYTDDAAHMSLVQGVLAEHRLFFLNSKTSATPVPGRIASEGGYPYLARDVFLDNVRDVGAIDRELRHAAARAERRGYAIAIGHPHRETYDALAGALSRGELNGVELVSLTDLMK